MKVQPIITPQEGDGDVVDVYFDLTVIITKQNELYVVDNSTEDYKDFIDSNTLIVKQVKLHP